MTLAIVGIFASLGAGIYGIASDNAPLMVLALFAFACAICASDFLADRFNADAYENLDHLNQMRIGLAQIRKEER